MRLKGQVGLISGAARNIGRAIALTFAREGADLILVAQKSRDELSEVSAQCNKLGVKTLPLLADVGNPDEIERVVSESVAHFGHVDTVVNVAALRPHKPFWEISAQEWRKVLAVNLDSTFFFAKALAPVMMKRKRGSIIALGGLASLTGQPLRAHVVASKTGLYGLIKSLAIELGPHGVRANLIAVGHIDTERRNPEWYPEGGGVPYMGERGAGSDGSALGSDAGTPLQRLGSPQEVANVALFLASDDSSFVTGDRIICAGGRYM